MIEMILVGILKVGALVLLILITGFSWVIIIYAPGGLYEGWRDRDKPAPWEDL